MVFFSSLSGLLNGATWKSVVSRRASRRTPRFVPRLEPLEDRTVPSTLTVSSAADDGSSGTLRAVIAAANPGDTIVFAKQLKGDTITLIQGQLTISKNLDIEGPGADQLTISGNHASRVFEISSGVTANVAGLTIANGLVVTADIAGGGGISNDLFATLNLTNMTLVNNQTLGGEGGGLYNAGTVTVIGCTFAGNQAIDSGSGFGGGGIANEGVGTFGGTISVAGSTFVGNQAMGPGSLGGSGGGIMVNNFPLDSGNSSFTLSNSAFTGNQGTGFGGGVAILGGPSTVSGSTFTRNLAKVGGGGVASFDTLAVTSSTFTANQAVAGGAINGGDQFAPLTVRTSTFTDNLARGDQFASGGAISSNLLTVTDSSFIGNQSIANGPPEIEPTAFGGAIDLSEFASGLSAPTVNGCSFANNQVISSYFAVGGAVSSSAPASLTNSTFSDNQALGSGPGAAANGGALDCFHSGMTVTNCTLTGNQAIGGAGGDGVITLGFGEGGGIDSFGNLTVVNSTLIGNRAIGAPLAPGAPTSSPLVTAAASLPMTR
jgi:hypothetical protein